MLAATFFVPAAHSKEWLDAFVNICGWSCEFLGGRFCWQSWDSKHLFPLIGWKLWEQWFISCKPFIVQSRCWIFVIKKNRNVAVKLIWVATRVINKLCKSMDIMGAHAAAVAV